MMICIQFVFHIHFHRDSWQFIISPTDDIRYPRRVILSKMRPAQNEMTIFWNDSRRWESNKRYITKFYKKLQLSILLS